MDIESNISNDDLIDNIFELLKGRSYLSVKETLNDCLGILETRAKVL